MAYSTWWQSRQRGDSNVKITTTVVEKNWLGRGGRAAARLQQDGIDSNGSGANITLLLRLRQDGSNGCDNTVAEQTCLGSSVSNINSSGETEATVVA